MKEIKKDRFGGEVEANDGAGSGIQGSAARKHRGDCAGRKQSFKHYANGRE